MQRRSCWNVERDGRGAPDGPLEDGERRCRAGVTDPDGRFRQDIGFLMLFRDGPQGYLPLGSPLDGPQSGECQMKGVMPGFPRWIGFRVTSWRCLSKKFRDLNSRKRAQFAFTR